MISTIFSYLPALAGIIWIDLLLSGDNAVVIALVCRTLPARQQRVGLALGTTGAILLRLVMAAWVSFLLEVEGLRIVGGILLLYIAVKLLWDEESDDEVQIVPPTLWQAVVAIAIADASMSLDNVMAVAALAHGNLWLIATGIILSIPFVIAGAAMIKTLVQRFPFMVWLGAALLGWVAVAIILEDPLIAPMTKASLQFEVPIGWISAAGGAISVLLGGATARSMRRARST